MPANPRLCSSVFVVLGLSLPAALGASGIFGASTTNAAGAPLPFDQAIDIAVANSLERKASEQELEAQTARKNAVQAEFGPSVKVGGDDDIFDKAIPASFGGATFLVRPSANRSAYLQVSQPLTGLYATYQRAGAERTQEEVARLSIEQTRINAAFAAAQAYRRAQEADEMLRIAQASILSTDSQARDANKLVETGRIIKSDLLKIEIARQEAKSAQAHAAANRKKAMANLAYILNQPEGTEIVLEPLPNAGAVARASAETTKMIVAQNTDFKMSLQKASDNRLDLKQAELAVEKAEYLRRQTDWRFAPVVNTFARYDRIYGPLPFGNVPYTRTLGISATWDIWDNGSRIFAHREIAAETAKAETMVQATKDKLRLELQSVVADLQAAQESMAAAQATVAQAEEAYRLDKARFSNGLVTATDLVISETAQTRARGALVSAMTDVDVLALMTQKVMGETRPHAILR